MDPSMKSKCLVKACLGTTLPAINSTWLDPGSNPGRRGEKPATNCLRYGTAFCTQIFTRTFRNVTHMQVNIKIVLRILTRKSKGSSSINWRLSGPAEEVSLFKQNLYGARPDEPGYLVPSTQRIQHGRDT
jgi:hypothetical protein